MEELAAMISAIGDLAGGLGDYNAGTAALMEAITTTAQAIQSHQWGYVTVGDYLIGSPALNNGMPIISGPDMVTWIGPTG